MTVRSARREEQRGVNVVSHDYLATTKRVFYLRNGTLRPLLLCFLSKFAVYTQRKSTG